MGFASSKPTGASTGNDPRSQHRWKKTIPSDDAGSRLPRFLTDDAGGEVPMDITTMLANAKAGKVPEGRPPNPGEMSAQNTKRCGRHALNVDRLFTVYSRLVCDPRVNAARAGRFDARTTARS